MWMAEPPTRDETLPMHWVPDGSPPRRGENRLWKWDAVCGARVIPIAATSTGRPVCHACREEHS
jgi:hypothetical protein